MAESEQVNKQERERFVDLAKYMQNAHSNLPVMLTSYSHFQVYWIESIDAKVQEIRNDKI